MKVSIIIDENCAEPFVEIHTASVSDEINYVVKQIASSGDRDLYMLDGRKGDFVTLLKPCSIMWIYSSSGKVFAETETDIYELKYRLYEIEEMMAGHAFSKYIRISNTDIINFDFVLNFDVSLSGSICVNFRNKKRAFVSRRYVAKIKKRLGINR
jgi:DNA-binding LytR/AlgR family response regulator